MQTSCSLPTDQHTVTVDVTAFSVTFEAAVSANEEEADFIPVSISHGFRWTCRASQGSRAAVGRLLSGDFHHWQLCRRRTYILYIKSIMQFER